jgi:hypothetical protein
MPEQLLDETNVGVAFQQMTSEPVAEVTLPWKVPPNDQGVRL